MEGQAQMTNRKFELALIVSIFSTFMLCVACGILHAQVQYYRDESASKEPVCRDIDWRYIECHIPENNCIVLDKFGDAMTCEQFYTENIKDFIYRREEKEDEQATTN